MSKEVAKLWVLAYSPLDAHAGAFVFHEPLLPGVDYRPVRIFTNATIFKTLEDAVKYRDSVKEHHFVAHEITITMSERGF